MVRCELCHEWYHFTCVDIKTGNKVLGLWLCERCDKHGPCTVIELSLLIISIHNQ